MSFPRAQMKRFNEEPGCAPPPGHYNMPDLKPGTGTLTFDTGGQRFKQENSTSTEEITIEVAHQLSTTFLTPNQPAVNCSKKKLNFVAPGAVAAKPKNGSNKSTPLPSPSFHNKEKQEYEKEIRRLIQQVNDQDRKIQSRAQDIQKLEGKLTLLTKDKSSLTAQVATAEKKTAALERSNSFLQNQKTAEVDKQNKRDSTEDELKKTKQKYETAKQELGKCRSLLVALQSDLETARSSISALQQSNHVLTQLNKEVQEHSDDVATQVAKLQGVADILRTEKSQSVDELTLTREKLEEVKNEFTQLLQNKVSEIEKLFEEKQKALVLKLENAEKEIANSSEAVKSLNDKIQELEKENGNITKEKNDFMTKLKILEEEHNQCSSVISDLQSSLTSLNESGKEFQKEKEFVEKKVEDLENQIERLTENHNQEIKTLEEQLQNTQAEFEQTLSYTVENKKELNQLEIVKSDLEEKISILLEKETHINKRFEEAEFENVKQEKEIFSLNLKLKETEEEKENARSDFEKNAEAFDNLQKENNNLAQTYGQSCTEVTELKEQIMLLEAKEDALETQLMKANQNASNAFENEETANQKKSKLEHTIKERETQYQAKLSEFTRRLLETQKKLNHKQQELEAAIESKENDVIEMKKMRKMVEERTEKLENNERISKENAILSEKVTNLQIQISSAANEEKTSEKSLEEMEKWQKLYQDLREKVEPFQVQLDAYSAEKSSLLNENSAAQAEMQTLGKKYAELLGHQNQKQKIRHVVKIKQENLDLKQEMAKLRTQVAKLQKQALSSRPSKFNPNDAFEHKKENATPFSHNN